MLHTVYSKTKNNLTVPQVEALVVAASSIPSLPSLMFFPATSGNWTILSRMVVRGSRAGMQARKGSSRIYSQATSPEMYLHKMVGSHCK